MTQPRALLALPLTALFALAGCSGGTAAPDDAVAEIDRGEAATATAEPTVTGPTPDPTPSTTEPRDASVGEPAQPNASPAPPAETALSRIPARFIGTWAPDKRACAGDYDYQPTFQRVFIERDRIGFFETSGDVQAVAEAGGSTRVTVRERIGDRYPVYPILISLADDGRALNYIRDGERRRLVKCSDSTAR